ncbi:MAG TPA: SufD family Fe-S cluster assembly protein, partial [Planctomycetota bacterium]|nr:SufD family Fe-S cluster assembly protein [Planctomycetota bacterium]
MTSLVETRDHYMAEFEKASKSLPGLGPMRQAALERFGQIGLPAGSEESWRFTDITPIVETPFKSVTRPGDPARVADLARGLLQGCQLTFVDGLYAPRLSKVELPEGVTAGPLPFRDGKIAERLGRLAPVDGRAFVALNTAFTRDGAYIRAARGVKFQTPIHLLFLSTDRGSPYVTHPRILIDVEEGAQLSIVESFLGLSGVYLTNAVTEISLGDHATLDYTKVQRESHQAYHVAALQVRQGRSSVFRSHSVALGAAISRNDAGSELAGEGAEATLNGLFEGTGHQVVDNHTTIDHMAPHTTSRELYKGILGGGSRGVFDGRIIVRPEAQKTNAMQASRNLLLSKDALVNTKPQL